MLSLTPALELPLMFYLSPGTTQCTVVAANSPSSPRWMHTTMEFSLLESMCLSSNKSPARSCLRGVGQHHRASSAVPVRGHAPQPSRLLHSPLDLCVNALGLAWTSCSLLLLAQVPRIAHNSPRSYRSDACLAQCRLYARPMDPHDQSPHVCCRRCFRLPSINPIPSRTPPASDCLFSIHKHIVKSRLAPSLLFICTGQLMLSNSSVYLCRCHSCTPMHTSQECQVLPEKKHASSV